MQHRSYSFILKIAALVGVLFPALVLAAPQDPPSAPVTVVNTPSNPVPVAVQGTLSGNVNVTNALLSVDALNDVLNEPYVKSGSNLGFTDLTFDVPDGKRLIVETITVRVALNAPGNAIAQFAAGNGGSGDISMQAQGTVDGSSWLIGVHPIKMRIDPVAGSNQELRFALRTNAGADGTWNVFVSGYLVPLPN